MATVRDEILQCLQLGGRQSAQEVAQALGRNEKLVMRLLRALADEGVVVFDRVPELRMLRLKGFSKLPVRQESDATDLIVVNGISKLPVRQES